MTQGKTGLKDAVAMQLHQVYFWHVFLIKSFVQKWADLELYGPKKVLFHVIKTWYFFEYGINSKTLCRLKGFDELSDIILED